VARKSISEAAKSINIKISSNGGIIGENGVSVCRKYLRNISVCEMSSNNKAVVVMKMKMAWYGGRRRNEMMISMKK